MNTEECKRTWGTAADGATFKDNEDYNARVAMWAVNNVDAVFAEIARLTALLAEAREGLKFYAKREFFAVMPDDGKTRVVPINNEDGTFAYWLAFVNDDGAKARAILAKLGA